MKIEIEKAERAQGRVNCRVIGEVDFQSLRAITRERGFLEYAQAPTLAAQLGEVIGRLSSGHRTFSTSPLIVVHLRLAGVEVTELCRDCGEAPAVEQHRCRECMGGMAS